jgi:hypothetical protein
MRESAFSSRYAPRRSIAAGVDGARLAVARCTWRVRAISVLARPAASMARISARLNSRIGQYRLTLLANIVMAWNTHYLQVMLDRAPGDHPDEVVSRLAPIGHKHINMRGILTFDLARYRSSLLRQPLSGAEDRVSR